MDQLSVCECPECNTHFAMASEQVESLPKITCPVCEERFDPNEDDEPKLEDEELVKLTRPNPRRRR